MTHSTQAINGEIACFDLVISTGNSKYPFLVGEVNAVDKLGSAEHHSGNQTDDVFVDFQAEVYSKRRVAEIEAHFSKLYGEPKRFEDISLYNVSMPPNSLIRISESDLPMLLESRENAEAFCNRVLFSTQSEKGYLIAVCDDSDFYLPNVAHIERNDNLTPWIYANDQEAAKGAELNGIKLIYGIKGVNDGVYIDTPQNRKLIKEILDSRLPPVKKPRKPSILAELQDGKKAAAQNTEPKTPTKKTEKEI